MNDPDCYLDDLASREKRISDTLHELFVLKDIIGVVQIYDAPPELHLVVAREIASLRIRSPPQVFPRGDLVEINMNGLVEDPEIKYVLFKIGIGQWKIAENELTTASYYIQEYLSRKSDRGLWVVKTHYFCGTVEILAFLAEYSLPAFGTILFKQAFVAAEFSAPIDAWQLTFVKEKGFNAYKTGFYGRVEIQENKIIYFFPPYNPPRPDLAVRNWQKQKERK